MKRVVALLVVLSSLVTVGVAQAGNAITMQRVIANYEGAPFNQVHITSVTGGERGSGRGWDCQSWWRWQGGTYFYSYNMEWTYPFTYKDNGGTIYLGSANTNGAAC